MCSKMWSYLIYDFDSTFKRVVSPPIGWKVKNANGTQNGMKFMKHIYFKRIKNSKVVMFVLKTFGLAIDWYSITTYWYLCNKNKAVLRITNSSAFLCLPRVDFSPYFDHLDSPAISWLCGHSLCIPGFPKKYVFFGKNPDFLFSDHKRLWLSRV